MKLAKQNVKFVPMADTAHLALLMLWIVLVGPIVRRSRHCQSVWVSVILPLMFTVILSKVEHQLKNPAPPDHIALKASSLRVALVAIVREAQPSPVFVPAEVTAKIRAR